MDDDMPGEPDPMKQELSCPVCLDIFREPVLLPCSHSLCRQCLQKSATAHSKCPVCRAPFPEGQAISNRSLSSACEVYQRQSEWLAAGRRRPGDGFCKIHWKPLDIYCEKDEEPVCAECVSLHTEHRLLSLKEGLPLCQKELCFKVEILEKKVDSYKRTTHKLSGTMEHIKNQAGQAEKLIKAEFQRFHEELHKAENERLQVLATEEEQKVAVIAELIAKTDHFVADLNRLIDSLRKEMGSEDLSFLQNFKGLKRKAQWPHEDPCVPDGSLLDMGKHVGSLRFKIWKNMQEHIKHYPVLLDPNTASPWLSLSDDLTSVKESSNRLTVPENPERFDPCVFVLGAEGYTSGRHRWDVIVGDSPRWIVGVCKESVTRKRKFTVSTNRGVWSVGLSKGVFTALTPERKEIPVQLCPKRIRVKLNMDKGEVSFWDGENENHLISFTHSFRERIFPIFGPGLHSEPMVVSHGKMVVHTS